MFRIPKGQSLKFVLKDKNNYSTEWFFVQNDIEGLSINELESYFVNSSLVDVILSSHDFSSKTLSKKTVNFVNSFFLLNFYI